MSEDESRSWWRVREVWVVGCTVGVLLGVGLVHAEFLAYVGSVTADIFGSNPGNALRVIQSIGILLPLFTGLLRFTTSDRWDVNERVDEYLLLGIVALVLAGVFAAVAGTLAETTVLLKLSMLFVLVAFTIIGFAAVMVFKGLDDRTGTNEPETNDIGGEGDSTSYNETNGDETVAESDSKNEQDESLDQSAESRSAGPEDDEEGQQL